MEFKKMAILLNEEINKQKSDRFKFQNLTEKDLEDICEHKKESRAREMLEMRGLNGVEYEYLSDFIWAWIRLQRRFNILV